MADARTTLHVNNIGREMFPGPGYLQDGDVVEFIGEQSTGKSTLLQQLMITCLLPSSQNGCHCGVIYFDLDYRFDLLRILSMMEQRTGGSEDDIKMWLKNMYVVRCEDSEQFLITLHAIEPLIANSKIPIGMLILDSVSSFHWIEAHAGSNKKYQRDANSRKIVQVLKSLKEKYRLCILASTQQLVNTNAQAAQASGEKQTVMPYKLFLSYQWQEFVKHRFVITTETQNNVKLYKLACLSSKASLKTFLIDDKGVCFT